MHKRAAETAAPVIREMIYWEKTDKDKAALCFVASINALPIHLRGVSLFFWSLCLWQQVSV
jgi:hypothetical protein